MSQPTSIQMLDAAIWKELGAQEGAESPLRLRFERNTYRPFVEPYIPPAVELALEHDDGTLVTLQGPAGPQFLRVGHAQALKPAVVQNVDVPPNAVRPSHQFVMYFASGLPLEPNRSYTWRVRIDHDTHDAWTETFYVATAATPPVLG